MIKKLLLLFVVSALTANLYSQAPANDCPCNAVSLTVDPDGMVNPGDCTAGDNTNATGGTGCEGSTTECTVNPSPGWDNTVWYSFVATDDSLTLNFGEGTLGTDLVASVYSGSPNCTNGSGITCIGRTSNGSEIDLTTLTVGQTYYVGIDGKNEGGRTPVSLQGTFCILVYETPPPPPPVGTCSNPRNLYIAADCNNISGRQYDEQNNMLSTDAATGNDGGASMSGAAYANSVETSCSGTDVGQQGYWVEFTATSTTVNVSNYGGSGYDYALFTGTPTNTTCTSGLTAAGCLSLSASDTKGSTLATTVGTTYRMLITPSTTGTATTAFACLTGTAYTAPNDDCTSATSVTTGTSYIINNSNATVDNNNTLCAGSTENNTWAVWTADFTGTAYVNLQDQDCINSNGMQMSLYSTTSAGCNPNSNGWACLAYVNPNNDNDFFGTINAVSGTTYYIQFDGYAGTGCTFNFCITTAANPDCALLLSSFKHNFSAKATNDNKVLLNWNIDIENVNKFIIERSNDLNNFKEINSIMSKSNVSYSFTDEHPLKGTNYYRIKFIDQNGGVNYSDIKHAYVNSTKDLFIIPNPVSDKMSVEFEANAQQDASVEIFDIAGRKVFQTIVKSQKGTNNSTVDISSLQSGVYFIYVRKDDVVIKERFVKQ